jgi:hypothetical protein
LTAAEGKTNGKYVGIESAAGNFHSIRRVVMVIVGRTVEPG